MELGHVAERSGRITTLCLRYQYTLTSSLSLAANAEEVPTLVTCMFFFGFFICVARHLCLKNVTSPMKSSWG